MQTDAELTRQARSLFERGDFGAAENAFRELLGHVPESQQPNVYLMLGACQQAQGRREEGVETIRRAIELDDERAESWFQLGRALQQGGDESGATEAFMKTIELDPNHALARVERGRQALAAGDRQSAEAHFRTALRADPECVPALAGHAGLLLDAGSVDKAYELAMKAVRLRPSSVEAQLVMARVFRRRGHLDFAERCLENALAAVPGSARLHAAMAQLLLERGRPDEALAAVTRARERGAGGQGLAIVEVHALRQLGRSGEARKRLESVASATALGPPDILLLADLRLADGDDAGVRELLDRLEADWPSAARLVRAEMAERAGDPAAARSLAEDLRNDESPGLSRRARLLCGRLALADADWEACVAALEPLAAEDRGDPVVEWMLARALDALGRHDQALPHLERAGWREPPFLQPRERELPEGIHRDFESLSVEGWPDRAPDDGGPQPVFVLGWPGSGREALLEAVAEQPGAVVLDRAGGARRREALGWPVRADRLERLDEAQVHLARRRYFRDAPARADRVVEPAWLPLAAMPAIARYFPGATVVWLQADRRDLEIDWRLSGFADIAGLHALLERELALFERLRGRLPLDVLALSREGLEQDAATAASEMARRLAPEDADMLASSIARHIGQLRPAGHWRRYAALFDRDSAG